MAQIYQKYKDSTKQEKVYPVTIPQAIPVSETENLDDVLNNINRKILNIDYSNIHGQILEKLSITYLIDDWKSLSKREQDEIINNFETVYITGDTSDWDEKVRVTSYYPADNIPADNTIYELGVRSELIIAGIINNSCASINIIAHDEGLTLGIADNIEVIGEIPENIAGGTKLMIGIVDGKLFVNEVMTFVNSGIHG